MLYLFVFFCLSVFSIVVFLYSNRKNNVAMQMYMYNATFKKSSLWFLYIALYSWLNGMS